MKTPLRRKLRYGIFFASFLLFPWTLNWLSPYLSVHGAWTGVVTGSVLVFALLFLTAPFLGRSFCSWLCPAGFAQEAVAQTRTKKAGKPALWRVKWFVWTPWLAGLASGWVFAGLKAVIPEWTPAYPMQQDFLTSVGLGTVTATLVTAIFVVLALLFGRRGGCHTLCWLSPFLILGRKTGRALHIPGLKLESTPASCIACGRCTAACPMGIPVQTMARNGRMEHSECILCADCVDTCPKRTIRLSFGRQG